MVESALVTAVAKAGGPLRLRLLVSREGLVRIEQQPFVAATGVVRAALALAPVDTFERLPVPQDHEPRRLR